MEPARCLATMDRKNIRTMVNLTGGYGAGLKEAVGKLQDAHSGRFVVFTEPVALDVSTGIPEDQGGQIESPIRAGAKRIKVLKTSASVSASATPKANWSRWTMPVSIRCGRRVAHQNAGRHHTSDPIAFFQPIDRFNERWEELHAHPAGHSTARIFPVQSRFAGSAPPSDARHPRTTIRLSALADSEDLAYVSECLDSHPICTSTSPRASANWDGSLARAKVLRPLPGPHLFGTDASAERARRSRLLAMLYMRFIIVFSNPRTSISIYAPAPVPPQGRWRIYGIGLPDQILRKVYAENAARLIGLTA